MSDYMPYLPEQLLAIIFFKLPAKTVLDCRCVCKSWCSVISDSNFLYEYNQRALSKKKNKTYTHFIVSRYDVLQSKGIFTVHEDDNKLMRQHEELDLPFDHGLSSYMIIGLCCGLVCLLEISTAERLPISLLIWNPSVGYSFKTFPIQPPVGNLDPPLYGYDHSIRFSEGNVLFVSSFGFGYDPKSNDYKVVRIVYRVEKGPGFQKRVPEIVDVFALSTGEWKNITASAPPYVIKESSVHAYVNFAVHWIGYYNGSHSRSISQSIVAVFDMSDEVFKQFSLPDGLITNANEIGDEREQMVSVGVVNESLVLLHYCARRYPDRYPDSYSFRRCYVWVMKEYGVTESWTLLFDLHQVFDVGRVLGVRRNGNFLIGAVNEKALFSVDPEDSFRPLTSLAVHGNGWCFDADVFLDCLIIYKKVNGVPMMSISSAATSCKHELSVRTSELKITDKGEEIMEEE